MIQHKMALTMFEWFRYFFILLIGFMIGRIATTIQFGLKYDKQFKELKGRYELKMNKKFKKKSNR
jgi:hypothetical protein